MRGQIIDCLVEIERKTRD